MMALGQLLTIFNRLQRCIHLIALLSSCPFLQIDFQEIDIYVILFKNLLSVKS